MRKFLAAFLATLFFVGNVHAAELVGPWRTLLSGNKLRPAFSADFTALSSLPSQITSSRASNAMLYDRTGHLTYAPNNLLLQSNTFSNAAWTLTAASVSSGQPDYLGGSNAWKITEDATANWHYIRHSSATLTVGVNTILTVIAKAAEETSIALSDVNSSTGVIFDLQGGTAGSVTGSDAGLTVSSPQITSLGSGFYQVSIVMTASVTGRIPAIYVRQYANSFTGTAGNGLYIYAAALSAVTYETTPRAADQVITTTSAYFGPRSDYDPSTLAAKGFLIEQQSTNVVLQNRDLTNASWTKTNITAAKDQTGPDGVANSASSITATAANGTVLQAITLASSQRLQSAFVQRISGTGTVNMTTDGGTTWTAITVPSGSWGRVSIPAQTVTNPSVGFQIVTSGDKIAVDFVQNETGFGYTSPIATTTASVIRSADIVQLAGTALTTLLSGTATLIVEARAPFLSSTSRLVGTTNNVTLLQSGNTPGTTTNTFNNSASLSATIGSSGSLVAGTRVGVAFSPAGRSIVGNGGTVATDTNTIGTFTAVYLGSVNGASNFWNGWISELAIYNTRLPGAILQAKSIAGVAFW